MPAQRSILAMETTPTLPAGADTIASALKALSLLRGRPFHMSSQAGRFRIQKTVYLLRRLGYKAAREFGFNLYLMGPYSPNLAKVYYAMRDAGLASAEPATDLPASTRDTVLDALKGTDAFLEALSTSLSVSSRTAPYSRSLRRARAIKPHIDTETWGEVERFVKVHPQLITHT
jgi:uncharacterized protein YwgA